MARKFDELRSRMPRKHRDRAAARAEAILAEMSLRELRQARELAQQDLAESLGQRQAGISKLERRADMYVSTLRRYIEAMGGQLDLVARFPEGDVRIGQFGDIEPGA